jgi:ribose/xylose/arabinose/galactoside ABC-type transport system permease subunit
VLALIVLFFSVASPYFLSGGNIVAMLHAMAPVVIISSGMALIVLTGNIDISLGSIAFLATSIGVVLVVSHGWPPLLAAVVILLCGLLFGALNGFIVTVLGINSLITTLGTMITLRGIGLELTNASVIPLPEGVRVLGNLSIGPVFVDVLVMAALVVAVHVLHARTPFGRKITAIGNGVEIAARIGLPVQRLLFVNFVIAGGLASLGGIVGVLQVGSDSAYLGAGMEFIAVAVVVVGGISLAGGRGRVIPGVLLGALTFEIIRNGLVQLSASPYAYKMVTGAVIFVAMYVDALKIGRIRVKAATAEE